MWDHFLLDFFVQDCEAIRIVLNRNFVFKKQKSAHELELETSFYVNEIMVKGSNS